MFQLDFFNEKVFAIEEVRTMEDIVLDGTVEDIIFQNKDNGYTVFSIQWEEDEVVCVGTMTHLHAGEAVKLVGSWVVHPMYGKQFQVHFFEKSVPTTQEGIEKYLSSGVIRGIGPRMAHKIVQKFGEATFYVIEEKPDRLAEIKGITYEKAKNISEVFREQHELRQTMMFLQGLGITPAFAMKIYKKYKGRTMDIVKTNPYRLADEIFGIGFKMADKLAMTAGISQDSSHRIRSAIKFVLNQGAGNGHIYLPKEQLVQSASELLQLHPLQVENCILELQVENQLWQEKIEDIECVYLNSFYYAEISVAKRLLELAEYTEPDNARDMDERIGQLEEKNQLFLADEQREAVKKALSHGLFIITGGPGTGKTTTINTILQLLQQEDLEILLAAPTGRAAKRMTEATGMEAQTIHRLLGINYVNEDSRRQTYDKNEENPIEADVIIIDESSMIDILLMHALLRAVAEGTRVIFVGDVDQLPSVGAGNVLKDMIRSERLEVIRLQQVFRQAQESAIIMNAHRINQGKELMLNDKEKDFFFMRRGYSEEVVQAIVELVTNRLPKYMQCDKNQDIQVLTPMRKSPFGVQNLNQVLQQALNPPEKSKQEKEYRNHIFRLGDKVMQIKNNYNIVWKIYNARGKVQEEGLGVFNGDQGRITNIDEDTEKIQILFDDQKTVEYDYSQLDELELAYAITIHKSQGSEYPVVVIPIHSGPPMLMTRNLLYTAVTRAKKLVVLVGLSDMVSSMIANNREVNRYSSLAYRIRNLYDFMFGNRGIL